ncbi:MAG: GGDEF domain-containing protein [Ruminococcus sp.]|nr:GGDEF domain-containing protein [Ruminococcus sp.]
MEKRKTICLITSVPEYMHGQRVFDGVFSQCDKYGYNVAVFASMVHFDFYVKNQAIGEKNIYNLMNPEHFDGVIIDTINLTEEGSLEVIGKLTEKLDSYKDLPVVCLGMPCKDYKVITDQDDVVLREMCRHVIEVHGKKNICLLTGHKGHIEAEQRLEIFLDEIHKHGITVTDDHIVYGDFWYSSGTNLAEDIISGKVSKPDAVIAASDHMALGLIEKLTKGGIRVPEDIIVVGFEATMEAAISPISLTSFESNMVKSAADAVDYIRSIIEPGADIRPFIPDYTKMVHCGMSCGCEPDFLRSADAFRDALYYTAKNYDEIDLTERIDIGLLMENYISEQLTSSENPQECLKNIYSNTYIVFPFVNFCLCLREDWLDTDFDTTVGYPDKMKIAIANSTVGELNFCDEHQSIEFDTKLMIPRMHEYTEKPCVFYFTAVHFNEKMLGYAVLQRELSDPHKINLVYRNWLRLVNSCFEMTRAKHRYVMLSVHDKMTGLYNRRGMYLRLDKMLDNATPEDSLFVSVVDMDGLKYINDTFGHGEGDFGIICVSDAVKAVSGEREMCVRAGGDEFYIIGIGKYDERSCHDRIKAFESTISEMSKNSGKPYTVSASIGCAVSDLTGDIDDALAIADENMYKYKLKRKRQRVI